MAAKRVEVTAADIARLAGVKPPAVSNWRRRHPNFPAAIGGSDRSPRFDLTEVEAWLRQQGKTAEIPADERLWQAFESARDALAPENALSMVGLFMLPGVGGGERLVAPSNEAEFRSGLDAGEHLLVTGFRAGAGVADLLARSPRPSFGIRQQHLLRAAAEAASAVGPLTAFDQLCTRFLERSARSGVTVTPAELATLMVDLASPLDGPLLDPACGSGTVLRAAARAGLRQVFGQEADIGVARLAALRMAALNSTEKPVAYDIHADDFLHASAFARGQAGAVVSNPPFGQRNWGHEVLTHDPSWEYGLPPKAESELAWVQHALAHVRPGGSVVMLMPPGAAQRPTGARVRGELVRRGALRAVFSLPSGLAAHYALALQIWVLHRPSDGPIASHVLMADLGHNSDDPRRDWTEIHREVTNLWNTFAAAPGSLGTHGERARAVHVMDLLGEDVDLSPRRYLPVPGLTENARQRLNAARKTLELGLTALPSNLPEVPSAPRNRSQTEVRFADLSELEQIGAVHIRKPTPAESSSTAFATIEGTIVTAQDVLMGRDASERGQVVADELRNPPLREGDVLIPALAQRITARVAVEADAGSYPAAGLHLIRTDPAILDPWFLAGYVSSTAGGRHAVRLAPSSGGTLRIDPRRVRVPMLPIEEQREHGALFRQFAQFSRSLRRLHDVGQQYADDAHDLLGAALQEQLESMHSADKRHPEEAGILRP
ncbi:N-6 DNA methylase [Streptomyces sp. NPDC006692]|uniref:N-6 DNA methylase n=1 Tax=Streptomyces sp. NPDC006692 TaxID=3364758 RepID=UPI0036B4424C